MKMKLISPLKKENRQISFEKIAETPLKKDRSQRSSSKEDQLKSFLAIFYFISF